jgi:hypothetical protein
MLQRFPDFAAEFSRTVVLRATLWPNGNASFTRLH